MILMLAGEAVLVEDTETTLRPGDAACWPAGSPIGHRLLDNRTDAPARYLVIGTCNRHDTIHYTDHDLITIKDGPARAICAAMVRTSAREDEMTDFTYAVDPDGVATITWDVAAKSMNVMSLDGFAQLDHIDTALADPSVKGVILTSGKKDFGLRHGSERDRPDAGGRRAGDL